VIERDREREREREREICMFLSLIPLIPLIRHLIKRTRERGRERETEPSFINVELPVRHGDT
jgi:hypothetical protein